MKKTMFITSVIMVVVMAIALTTSSLAWFSAAGATTVETSEVAISARANSSTGLYISNDATAWQQGELAITPAVYNQYVPVAPYGSSASADADDLLAGLQNDQFVTNTVKVVSGGDRVWAAAYSEAATNFYKETSLYVANAGDAAIAVSADVDFADVHGATLFVAVLAKHQSDVAANDDSDWELIALESSASDSTFAVARYADEDHDNVNDFFDTDAAVADALALSVAPGTNLNSKTTFDLARKTGNAAYGDYMQVKILAWYSTNLTNQNSGSYYKYENGAYVTTGQNNVAKSEGTYAEFTVTFGQESANA